MAKVTVYTAGFCPFCYMAKRLLKSKGVEFTEIDITFDAAKRAEVAKRAGQTSVPQIWIGDQHVGGSDELQALERAGRLDEMLGQPS